MEQPIFTAGQNNNYNAQVLADSIANGVRLTTVVATMPRFILAELNTHRVFSRNSASSRAIPTEVNIERVLNDPFVPDTFNSRVKGMGVGEAFEGEAARLAQESWLRARDVAASEAHVLNQLGIDKSRANRLLEPFMWHTVIITSTEWTNFMGLRCPEGDTPTIDFPAQLEMQQISILMRQALRESTPQELGEGDWHLPMITEHEFRSIEATKNEIANEDSDRQEQILDTVMKSWCMVSSRRLARVSFDKHTDTEPISVSIDKAGDLAIGGHFSPFEHIATPIGMKHVADPKYRKTMMVPMDLAWDLANRGDVDPRDIGTNISNIRCGNLRGWYQFRKEFAEEADHSMILDYKVI